jgi:2-succinyl-5-enolpyruvyl-6-hydroxy-3-cyclohexene-1-carboxylate synthase
MKHYYTDERNAQIVISLMKAHNIKKVIASPGTTNICFVASIQQDPYFEIYSAPDERSAGYIACGLSAESGEPVALSCTGATASRNYMSALTEAFYRKLPILAITSSRRSTRIGHNFDQVTDRRVLPKDVAKISEQLPLVYDAETEWACMIAANKAMLELKHHGCGPVHINLETNYSRNYSVKEIPPVQAIYRINTLSKMPELNADRIAIMVGAHLQWSEALTEAVDRFCEANNAIVLCDHISNYKGKYRIFAYLLAQQEYYVSKMRHVDLIIHIGDITGSKYNIVTDRVWRVNPDGELRDTYGKLQYVFELEEEDFFRAYTARSNGTIPNTFYTECREEVDQINSAIPELPFSNAWVASKTASRLPENSVLHLGIQNSLRFWNFFDIPLSVFGYSNTGGFGIDGSISSTIGAALAKKDKIFFCVLGDLAFFYDMNSLGNRHVGSNVRILLVNNGRGTEFKLSGNPGSMFGDDTDTYIAAAGHYGNKSKNLVRHFAEDLGFEYLSASSKEEYLNVVEYFITPEITSKPIIFEIFTDSKNEDTSLTLLTRIGADDLAVAKMAAKGMVKDILGEHRVNKIKELLGKGTKN